MPLKKPPVPSSAKGKLTISVALTFLIVSTAGLFYLIYPEGPEVPEVTVQREFNPPDNSIAVLPFVNMSDDPDNVYFSDGVAEEVLHKLTMNPNLFVTARTSSFKYRDNSMDIRAIGEQLNVAKILEGSVRKAGRRVRVTVQLINSRDGYHDWSETFDRELTDIFAIQDEIASSVGDELELKMAVASRSADPDTRSMDSRLSDDVEPFVSARSGPIGYFARSAPPQGSGELLTDNSDAYDRFLRARYQLQQGTHESIQASIATLLEIVESNPRFAKGWLGLAEGFIALDSGSLASNDLILEAAIRAIREDPTLGRGYAAMGKVYESRGEILDAGRAFSRAVALSPGDADVLGSYGADLQKVGFSERAREQLSAAVQRDPLSMQIHTDLALTLAIQGDLESAKEHAEQAQQLGAESSQNDSVVIGALLRQGEFALAKKFAKAGRARHGKWFWPSLVIRAIENPDSLPAAVAEIREMTRTGLLADGNAVIYLALLRDVDSSYEYAWPALESKSLPMEAIWGPGLVAFRQDPRFSELSRRSGLMKLWQEVGPPDNCALFHDAIECD